MKLSKCLRYTTIFLFVWMVCLSLPNPSFAQEASMVRATQIDGKVTRNSTALKEGGIIQRGDKITISSKSGAVLTWSNGSMIKLYQNSSLKFNGVVFERDRKMEKTFLTLEKGRAFVKAQVPEHMFEHFEMLAGGLAVKAQASEFAVKYNDAKDELFVWSLIGTTIIDLETDILRVNEGQQVKLISGLKPDKTVSLSGKIQAALMKVSKRLGGSLLVEEESGSIGGPLRVKIGGVKNRRGNAPYTVNFKAIVNGGSGELKSIRWNFGDGKSAEGKKVENTFTQGVYGVSLSVEDKNGDKATGQINISVEEDCDC